MAKILNFGSLNIDYVYDVPHFVRPGETLAASGREVFRGGKGLNQSIALGRAGALVFHAGAVGGDGGILTSALEDSGVDISLIGRREGSSGHAVIQRDAKGQNCILLHGGANQTLTSDEIDRALSGFGAGDFIVLQNEINMVREIIARAKERGLTIVLNPSPMSAELLSYPLELVNVFILNEVEAAEISGETKSENMLGALSRKFPKAAVVLTLGKLGVRYTAPGVDTPLEHGIYRVPVVDTTAAGDTFTGYFVAAAAEGAKVGEALRLASIASSIAVSRKGAEPSIPYRSEVLSSGLELES